MKTCCVINGESFSFTWYDLLDALVVIRKLEMHGLVNGTEIANKLLEYYCKNYKEGV